MYLIKRVLVTGLFLLEFLIYRKRFYRLKIFKLEKENLFLWSSKKPTRNLKFIGRKEKVKIFFKFDIIYLKEPIFNL